MLLLHACASKPLYHAHNVFNQPLGELHDVSTLVLQAKSGWL